MRVFVVTETYFNGEDDSVRVSDVFLNEDKANAFVDEKNKSSSPYSSTYEVNGMEVID
jgi:hypothetical protein